MELDTEKPRSEELGEMRVEDECTVFDCPAPGRDTEEGLFSSEGSAPPDPCTFSAPWLPGFIDLACEVDGAEVRPVLIPPGQISTVYWCQCGRDSFRKPSRHLVGRRCCNYMNDVSAGGLDRHDKLVRMLFRGPSAYDLEEQWAERTEVSDLQFHTAD